MHTKEMGTFEHGDRHRTGGPVSPFMNRLMSQVPDELFAGQSGKHRVSKLGQHIEFSEQFKVMLLELTKTEPWVKNDLLRPDAVIERNLDSFAEEQRHFIDDVLIPRRLLHGLRRPLHVHEDHGGAGFRHEGSHERIASQRADVIDDGRTGLNGSTGDGSFGRIDRNGNRNGSTNRFQHRDETPQLFGFVDGSSAGAGRLGTDVDDIGPFLLHLYDTAPGLVDRDVGPAV